MVVDEGAFPCPFVHWFVAFDRSVSCPPNGVVRACYHYMMLVLQYFSVLLLARRNEDHISLPKTIRRGTHPGPETLRHSFVRRPAIHVVRHCQNAFLQKYLSTSSVRFVRTCKWKNHLTSTFSYANPLGSLGYLEEEKKGNRTCIFIACVVQRWILV